MWMPVKITIATDTQKSAAFKTAAGTHFLAVYVPTITNGTVSLEAYLGTPPTDGTAAVLAADQDTDWKVYSTRDVYTPAGTGDTITRLANFPISDVWCRLTTSSVQAANREFKVILHGHGTG